MPQLQLPFFPEGVTHITPLLAFRKEDGRVVYFNGSMPVFVHDESDLASFRMITAQFCVNGNAKQAEIAAAFGVAKISLKRAVKRYRAEGPRGFYVPRKGRGPAVLTPAVLAEAQQLLDDGLEPAAVAERLGVKPDTLSKAVRAGRLHRAQKKNPGLAVTSKSERSAADRAAPLGMGAADLPGRMAASVGELDAVAPCFAPALDVPNGGVLCALPALLAMGLPAGVERFLALPKGYYGLDSLLILLAFMALARLASIEALRYCAPGEWGNLLGLDRVPEVRTLRAKIQLLAHGGEAEQWGAALCERWMADVPEQAGVLYIDGHVRVYRGSQTPLPRHYVARQRLCLRATVDYWVNAMDGQHQTAILCTDYRSPAAPLAAAMFARWSQENFFKYARGHYGLDRLTDYRVEPVSDPLQVVNPDYRHLDGQVRSLAGKLTRRLANFAAVALEEPIEPEHVEPFVRRKAALHEEIEALQGELATLKAKRKATPHHIAIGELPEEARFLQLATQSKQLVDTIKMIAYRAETAMANSLREHLKRPDEARRLLCSLYTTEADLLPDPAAGTLTVRLHHAANAVTDRAIEKLCEELNATETVFPRTNLRLVLKVGSG